MGKKKPFIDKKKSSHYSLVHRSQRDVAEDLLLDEGDTQASGVILWPQKNSNLPSTNAQVMNLNNNQTGSTTSTTLSEWKTKLQQHGLLRQDAESDNDNNPYVKSMSGQGMYIDANTGRVASTSVVPDDGLLEIPDPHGKNDLPEYLDLTTDCMDDDVMAILFQDDGHDQFTEGQYEELDDDMVLQAAQEPQDAAASSYSFDFDAHIQSLLEKARGGTSESAAVERMGPDVDDDEWRMMATAPSAAVDGPALGNNDEDDDDQWTSQGPGAVATSGGSGVVPQLRPEEERALCEKFEATLAEYDDDETDDDDDDDDNFCGSDVPQDDEVQQLDEEESDDGGIMEPNMEALCDEFLQQSQQPNEIYMRKKVEEMTMTSKKKKKGGYSVLVGTQMVPVQELNGVDPVDETQLKKSQEDVEQVLRNAKERLALPVVQPPPEEILIDGQSYFSERKQNPWDCESILSTYSNLDNRPITISTSRSNRRGNRNRQQRRQQQSSEPATTDAATAQDDDDNEAVRHIALSNKTGLPVVSSSQQQPPVPHNNTDNDDDTATAISSINRGMMARNKHETKQEKRNRKLLVQKQKQLARIQKKVTQQVFAEEFHKKQQGCLDDPVAHKTVFRYS